MDKLSLRRSFYEDYVSRVLSLYSYQYHDYLDDSRLVVIEKSRQVGYSWCLSLRCLVDAVLFGDAWYIFSISKEEARNKIMYASSFIKLLSEVGFDCGLVSDNSYGLEFSNGGIVKSLSYRQGRGYSGNVLIDEFLWIPQDSFDALMRSIRPLILRGNNVMRLVSSSSYSEHSGYLLRNRVKDWRYIYWWDCPEFVNSDYVIDGKVVLGDVDIHSLSTVDRVYRFGSDGLKDLYEDYGSSIDFAREFECYSSWSPEIIFDMSLLEVSIDEGIEGYRYDGIVGGSRLVSKLREVNDMYYVGFDVGRRRNSSELVFINMESCCVEYLLSLRDISLEEQCILVGNLLDTGKIKRLAIDAGGIGLDISERLRKIYHGLVECVVFSNELKVQLVKHFSRMLGRFKMPYDSDLISHIVDLRLSLTSANNMIYKSKTKRHNNDMFWALCLGLRYFDNFSSVGESVYIPLSGDEMFRDVGKDYRRRLFSIFRGY